MSDRVSSRFDQANREPYWFGTVDAPGPSSALTDEIRCDLAIIGGGFTGLWSAVKARARFPDARIVVLESAALGEAASGRNGGFCAPSISHGVGNAETRWPAEAETLVRLGRENFDAMQRDLEALEIECEFERKGKLNVAATEWQAAGLSQLRAAHERFGVASELLDKAALKDKLNSPHFVAGLYEPDYALVNPFKISQGLARVARKNGVEIYENTRVIALASRPDGVSLVAGQGRVVAQKVVLATNAALPLLKRLRSAIIPIYDYTLVTEPLSEDQLAEIGWTGRYGIADSGNQFHYSRKTADHRILWGGYDAIYHFGSRREAALQDRPESFARLQANFDAVFPSLSGVTFSHAWGGIIDTSARLTFFTGTACKGRLAYALGFTGQGVSATRFAALAMLDLLEGVETARTRLAMLRRRPVPFPPEPLRSLAIGRAQRDLAREDETGKRSTFLKTLDRLGIGFGS